MTIYTTILYVYNKIYDAINMHILYYTRHNIIRIDEYKYIFFDDHPKKGKREMNE